MRISIITDGIYPYVLGGMQKHSFFLVKYFALSKVHVDLYHFVPENQKHLKLPFTEEELKYITIFEIEYPKSKLPIGHYLHERSLYSKEVYRIWKQQPSPDFIYVKGFSGWEFFRQKDNLQVPIGVNFHGFEMFQKWPDLMTGLKLQLLKHPVKYHLNKANFAFSYGGKITNIIESLKCKSSIIEIPSGISEDVIISEREIKKSEKIRKFVFVGRAERRKGIQEINEVLKKTANHSKFEFHFIGPVPEYLKIDSSNVQYHGSINDRHELLEILDQMDILVCPSHSEGMPNVILEGLARGLAIIATDVGAVSKMVSYENGWILDPRNISADLYRSIIESVSVSPELLDEKKVNSLSKVATYFTWEKVINKTIKEIEAVI